MSITRIKKMFEHAEKTLGYKLESFKIVTIEELLEVLTPNEITKLLGAKKAKEFLSCNMTPMRFIGTLMDICEQANLDLKFRKREN